MPPRRHDIDALRALAFALLILYHWCMLYVGGEDWDWHLKSPHLAEWLQLPMLVVNRWRMDLIFLISGLSVHFLLRGTRTGAFIARPFPPIGGEFPLRHATFLAPGAPAAFWVGVRLTL